VSVEGSRAPAGPLACYGAELNEAYAQEGIYVACILKGAKPAELSVMQTTKFLLVINRGPFRGHEATLLARRGMSPPGS
jgi:hypothetical protein